MKQRIKHCNVCKVDFSTMYRIQYNYPKAWAFVCKACLIRIKKTILTINTVGLGRNKN